MTVVNRTQALVLGCFVQAWVALITILVAAPEVYDRALRQAPGSQPATEIVFAAGLSGLIAVVCVAVARRRRWAFWLTLIAFLAGCFACQRPRCNWRGTWRQVAPPGTSPFRA